MQNSRYSSTNINNEYLIYPFNSPINYNFNYSGTFSKFGLVDKFYLDSLIKNNKRLIIDTKRSVIFLKSESSKKLLTLKIKNVALKLYLSCFDLEVCHSLKLINFTKYTKRTIDSKILW